MKPSSALQQEFGMGRKKVVKTTSCRTGIKIQWSGKLTALFWLVNENYPACVESSGTDNILV